LSKIELSFYCGINEENIEKISVIRVAENWRKKKRTYLWPVEHLNWQKKMEITSRLLEESNCRSLILFNNSTNCRKAYNKLTVTVKKERFFIYRAD